jgi:hypothetical protein
LEDHDMSDNESASKDTFFQQLASIANEMTAAHGKDFAMGALVLAARFLAESEARERAAAEANGSASNTASATQ